MQRVEASVLGLFPPFAADAVGGVQTSGRMAWQGILEAKAQLAGGDLGTAHLFCYGKRPDGRRDGGDGRTRDAHSKIGAVIAAGRARWSVRLVVVWHLALLKLLPFFRVPDASVAVFLHGIEAWKPQDWLTRTLLRRVDLFLSNSEHTWQRFTSLNPGFRAAAHETVHLGVGSPLEGLARPPSRIPIALMVSRLLRSEGYKGHREVIAAWPLVVQRVPQAELWIVGDGDSREHLERAAMRTDCAGRIRFWRHVSETHKAELLAQSRCLVLPSRCEGFGLVYLEAMRMGRPCLVSSVDAGREVVNPPEAGLATDPGDPSRLADSVSRLLALGSQWEEWSERARRRYESQFTARHFQERLVGALSGSRARAVAV